jgi:phytoene dehydrogenase-like protein
MGDVTLSQQSLEIEKIRAQIRAVDESLRKLEAEVSAAEQRAKGAFEQHDLKGVEEAWAVHRGLQEQRTALQSERQRVLDALAEKVRPIAEEWRVVATATTLRWRADQDRLVDRIYQLLGELDSSLSELAQLPERRKRGQEELYASLAELAQLVAPLPLSAPAVDWAIPKADTRAISGRLAELARKLGARVLAW